MKKSQSSRNQGFTYYFCLMMDPDPYLLLMDPDPGGPKTSGSATLLGALKHQMKGRSTRWVTALFAGYGVGHVLNDLCASMWFTYLLLFYHKVQLPLEDTGTDRLDYIKLSVVPLYRPRIGH
jgi:hypothetical protein